MYESKIKQRRDLSSRSLGYSTGEVPHVRSLEGDGTPQANGVENIHSSMKNMAVPFETSARRRNENQRRNKAQGSEESSLAAVHVLVDRLMRRH